MGLLACSLMKNMLQTPSISYATQEPECDVFKLQICIAEPLCLLSSTSFLNDYKKKKEKGFVPEGGSEWL